MSSLPRLSRNYKEDWNKAMNDEDKIAELEAQLVDIDEKVYDLRLNGSEIILLTAVIGEHLGEGIEWVEDQKEKAEEVIQGAKKALNDTVMTDFLNNIRIQDEISLRESGEWEIEGGD